MISQLTSKNMGAQSAKDLETLRLHALEELALLDSPVDEAYDRIVRMASRLFDTSVAAVSLTDRSRQFFKSHIGIAGRQVPRAGSPCAEVTRLQQYLHVPNLLEDERFVDSALVRSGIRFYAGAPLTTRDGYTLGAMCVLDTRPRIFTSEQTALLHDFAAMVMAQIEMQHKSGRIDATSGLPNRHQLYDDFEICRRLKPDAACILLVVELTDLRHVNEAVSVLGASYLDTLVNLSAAAIRSALIPNPVIYQVGFASLAMLFDESHIASKPIMEQLIRCLKVPHVANGIPVVITAVLGASPFLLASTSPQDALRTAVSAARQARKAEVDYAVFNSDEDKARSRTYHLLSHVRQSLDEQRHFSLVYQPRLDLRTGLCTIAEALLRWTHPTLGSILPGEFIPLIEQTALTRPMTRWVFSTAFQQLALWQQAGLDMRLSINVSARNLEEEDFPDLLAQTLELYDIRPDRIELEFTESAMIRHRTRVLAHLNAIRAMGLSLAIDDFGTGYSSYAYLHEIPATIVKLDQSFMHTLIASPKDQSMVRSMISLAQQIGYRVVGEGVETEDVLDFLRASGCDEIQGYLIAHPLAADDLADFMIKQTTRHMRAA